MNSILWRCAEIDTVEVLADDLESARDRRSDDDGGDYRIRQNANKMLSRGNSTAGFRNSSLELACGIDAFFS